MPAAHDAHRPPHTGGSWCDVPTPPPAVSLARRADGLVAGAGRGLVGVGRSEEEALSVLGDKLFAAFDEEV